MSRGVNKVILVGRLGSDPDIRFTPNGAAVARFNIATTERVPVGEGAWDERTEWHRIVVFGKLAETCGNYLAKGRLVYIEGRLRTQQWEDNQGIKRFTTEIVARDIQFLDSAVGAQREGGVPQRQGRDVMEANVMPEDLPSLPPTDMEDDIPF
jgi:single-strand DNA-binding protein